MVAVKARLEEVVWRWEGGCEVCALPTRHGGKTSLLKEELSDIFRRKHPAFAHV